MVGSSWLRVALGASRIKKAISEISTLFNAPVTQAMEKLAKASKGLFPPGSVSADELAKQASERNESGLKLVLSKGGVPRCFIIL